MSTQYPEGTGQRKVIPSASTMTIVDYFAAHAPPAPAEFVAQGKAHGADLAECHAEWAREYANTLFDAMRR